MKTNYFIKMLNRALNDYLQLDPDSNKRLNRLKGRAIHIEIKPFQLHFYCEFTKSTIQVLTEQSIPPETKITGTPLQLFGVAISKENRHRFFAEDVKITGDAELGQQVISLFDELDIDWEEYLSQGIGDVPAHQTFKFLKKVGNWYQRTESRFMDNLNEFLHEEIEWFPAREALQDFFADIDDLRMDTDRLAARILRLQKHVEDEV